jgi:hypothetical protein
MVPEPLFLKSLKLREQRLGLLVAFRILKE